MRRLPIDRIEPGMTTVDPIVSDKGVVLCGKGTLLSENLIFRLKKLGVALITVESEEAEAPESKEDLSIIRQEVEERFSKVRADPLMQRLKEVVLKVSTG